MKFVNVSKNFLLPLPGLVAAVVATASHSFTHTHTIHIHCVRVRIQSLCSAARAPCSDFSCSDLCCIHSLLLRLFTSATMANKTLILNVMYLALFSMLGVLSRIYLAKIFRSHDGVGADVTSQNGPTFTDLPANAIGTFLIGMVSSASFLSLKSSAAVAILAGDHVFQDNAPLQLGFRTGYCGSLTTFASWDLQMVEMIVHGHTVAALWGYFIGVSVAMISFYIGLSFATSVFLFRKRRRLANLEKLKQAAASSGRVLTLSDLNQPLLSESTVDVEPGAAAGGGASGAAATTAAAAAAGAAVASADIEPVHVVKPTGTTDAAFGLLLLALVIMTIVLCKEVTQETTTSFKSRVNWFAMLFGPFGTLLRWQLGVRFNGKLKRYPWFPIGTFTANVLASTVNGIFSAVMVKNPNDYWVIIISTAITEGFSGSLSTVSTWATELFRLLPQAGDGASHRRAYSYGFCSLFVAGCMTAITYAWTQ